MSRGLTGPPEHDPERSARAFVGAFNDRDLDRLVSIVSPDVEIHSMRGTVTGREAAREWATRKPGGVQQTIEVVSTEVVGRTVLLEVDRVWRWAEDDSHAGTDEMAWLFEVGEDGLVDSWRPFDQREAARAELPAA